MTAPAYQPVPTAHQRRELERLLASDRAKRHAVRQYEKTQALISPVEAAGVACCDVTPEPDPVEQISEDFVIAALGVSVLCLLAIAFTWGIPA